MGNNNADNADLRKRGRRREKKGRTSVGRVWMPFSLRSTANCTSLRGGLKFVFFFSAEKKDIKNNGSVVIGVKAQAEITGIVLPPEMFSAFVLSFVLSGSLIFAALGLATRCTRLKRCRLTPSC